mmetsp:Transcript_19766/g.30503  ORF Transcript_19766/g.30503 Transcript_19766/m.30503 type:complete len:425 (+) Transcript_19766:85-1359(+)|eukprot:CAMPEP_0195289638 /NCGR_PEP_ID=MMETSP0707-20130614/5833_1 /TAXON_ID=33640 /ORGANISM="Asterionellopsis glacialis, Strain CCMP134" /LENGTH=424 /DNA_ID=CAMNT_0040349663 /DNA_START=31 /DNA_END=1305 /DNA_ORIENTATION=+
MSGHALPPAYALERTEILGVEGKKSPGQHGQALSTFSANTGDSMSYSEPIDDGESYIANSSVTAGVYNYKDATKTVHEMHLALLYLLSNPDEFQKALHSHPPRGATTLADWNAEYEQDDQTVDDQTASESVAQSQQPQQTPLPFVVFADDAEVVLPQAHTASQLFGIEKVEGIELEAAAGVPGLSQLFLRWLALMPGGDHLNIIDPPGLTVMRIAGGRYRVTAAHRVVWTWMNEFAPLLDNEDKEEGDPDKETPHIGDLVSMTIVDVFETDNNGRLLSYCPTFDNRAVFKTNQTSESLRKGSAQLLTQLNVVAKSEAATKVNKAAHQFANMSMNAARNVATSVRGKIDEKMRASPQRKTMDAKGFEQALEEAEAAGTINSPGAKSPLARSMGSSPAKLASSPVKSPPQKANEHYISDDEMVGEV